MYDGQDADALALRLDLPRVVVLDRTTSTMDVAHELASSGAPAGTLVVANEQTEGRGRSGARWIGVVGESILCTLIERPQSSAGLDVLSLRVGLELAHGLDAFAEHPVGVKWPNDLIVDDGKLAGVLIEARWRNASVEWVTIAVGVNIGAPPGEVPGARGLRTGVRRLDVLAAIVPAMRRAGGQTGVLTGAECTDWRARDRLAGRRVRAPVAGVVCGILPTGELVIDTANGRETLRAGSVTLEDA
jgi:BirA family biotin operon repressor/biotin-[acetyl-CoA-carboxylase] ligase